MEEISLGGEIYIKGSVLAKKFGYTSDYLGQLCRSKQIKATLIGRSWYVNEASLIEHKKNRYRSSSAKTKESLREMAEQIIQKANTPSFGSKKTTRYERDENDLLPSLTKPLQTEIMEYIDPIILPQNKAISDEIQSQPIILKKDTIKPRPPLRTIPHLGKPVPSAINVVKSSVMVRKPRKKPRKPLLIVCAVLLVEAALLTGGLGLEKRVIVPADQVASLVLYNFDSTEVTESIKAAYLEFFDR